jgi:hypothetical protein
MSEHKEQLSFAAEPRLKQQLLAHLSGLAAHPALWQQRAIAWDGHCGSAVGHLLQSDNLSDWEALGLPKWLAYALDYFLVSAPSLAQGIDAVRQILAAIPVAVDLQYVGSQYLLELLVGSECGIRGLSADSAIEAALASVVAVQQQCVSQQTVAAAAWRSLRGQLVASSNRFEEDVIEHWIGLFLESCAWNPEASSTVVFDALRGWNRLRSNAILSPVWDKQQDIRVQGLLAQLYQQAQAQQPADDQQQIDVMQLLQQAYPEDARWFQAQMQWNQQQPAVYWQKAQDCLRQLLLQADAAA